MRKGGVEADLGDVLGQDRTTDWGSHGNGEKVNTNGRKRRKILGRRRPPEEVLRQLQGNQVVIIRYLEENL